MSSKYPRESSLAINDPDRRQRAVTRPTEKAKKKLAAVMWSVTFKPSRRGPATKRLSLKVKRYRGTRYHCQLYPRSVVPSATSHVAPARTHKNMMTSTIGVFHLNSTPLALTGAQLNFIIFELDDFVKSPKPPFPVIPVKTGIQEFHALLDSRLRGSDDLGDFVRDRQSCFGPNPNHTPVDEKYSILGLEFLF